MQSTLVGAGSGPEAYAQVNESSAESSAVDSVMHALLSIGRLMRQKSASDNLDPGTFWLLKTLATQGSMRVTDLAAYANLDTSTVSRHVTHLDRSGLIDRAPDPDDGRAQRVQLSEFGTRQLGEAMDQRRALLLKSLQGWDTTDIEDLDRLLARFVGNIDQQTEDLEHQA